MIVAGRVPLKPLALNMDAQIVGTAYLLDRCEMGVINIGGAGKVWVDGEALAMAPRDGRCIGMGAEDIAFESDDPDMPAKCDINCAQLVTGPALHSRCLCLLPVRSAR